jgi:hypothetical protein
MEPGEPKERDAWKQIVAALEIEYGVEAEWVKQFPSLEIPLGVAAVLPPDYIAKNTVAYLQLPEHFVLVGPASEPGKVAVAIYNKVGRYQQGLPSTTLQEVRQALAAS